MAEAVAASPQVIATAASVRRIGEQVAGRPSPPGTYRTIWLAASAAGSSPAAVANQRLLDGAVPALTRVLNQQRLAQRLAAPAFTRILNQQRLAAPALTRMVEQQRLFQGLAVAGPPRAHAWRRADVAFIGRVALPAAEQISQMLWRLGRAWDHALPSIGWTLARVPLLAALAARRAALCGDWQTVVVFVQRWLGRRATVPLVEAAIEALLDDGWLPTSEVLEPAEVIRHLRGQTSPEHTRRYRLIGATQIAGRRIDSLDRPVPLPSGDVVALVELTPAPLSLQQDHPNSPRLARALPMFKPEEQQVLLAWEPGMTWRQAADACGLPSSVGERVRRKRGRVAAEVHRRFLD